MVTLEPQKSSWGQWLSRSPGTSVHLGAGPSGELVTSCLHLHLPRVPPLQRASTLPFLTSGPWYVESFLLSWKKTPAGLYQFFPSPSATLGACLPQKLNISFSVCVPSSLGPAAQWPPLSILLKFPLLAYTTQAATEILSCGPRGPVGETKKCKASPCS